MTTSCEVKFGGTSIGQMIAGSWRPDTSRDALVQKPPKLKGCKVDGQGGGMTQIAFTTRKQNAGLSAAMTWWEGLVALPNGAATLTIEPQGIPHSYSGVVLVRYSPSQDGPSGDLLVQWTFSMPETTCGTF